MLLRIFYLKRCSTDLYYMVILEITYEGGSGSDQVFRDYGKDVLTGG